MITQESLTFRLLIVLLYGGGIFCSIIILKIHSSIPRLQQNPGKLIQSIFTLQILISTQMIISQFYDEQGFQQFSFAMPHKVCNWLGVIQSASTISYTLLNAFLIINIMAQIKQKQYDYSQWMLIITVTTSLTTFIVVLFALMNQDIGISVIGDCNIKNGSNIQNPLSYLSIVLLLTLLFIILYWIYHFKVLNTQTEIYKTNILKFNRKYQAQYLKSNTIYGLIFIFVRLLPEILLIWSNSCKSPTTCSQVYLGFLASGSLILALTRYFEPIFNKHCKYRLKRTSITLEDRLINKKQKTESYEKEPHTPFQEIIIQQLPTDSGVSNLKIIVYHQEDSVLSHKEEDDELKIMPSLVKQLSSIYNSHRRLPSHLDIYFEFPQEFAYILLASAQMIDDCIPKKYEQLSAYFFNKMICKRFQISITEENLSHRPTKPSVFEITNKYSEHGDGSIEVFSISYGQSIMNQKLKELFDISVDQIRKSLSWQKNLKLLKQMPQSGTVMVSYDGLIAIEIISKIQKLHMSRGGGLLQLWQQLQQETINNRGIFLPVVFGLHSFIIGDIQYSIVLKLNRMKILYPLLNDQWNDQQILNGFLEKNIIGWITVHGTQVLRRFMAKDIRDGSYELHFQKSDYLLDKEDRQFLIQMIKQNYSTLMQMKCKLNLQFVYTKNSKERLASLMQREKKGGAGSLEEEFSLTQNIVSNHQKFMQFELGSRLGYVDVFWDDSWRNDDEEVNLTKLLQIVNERF